MKKNIHKEWKGYSYKKLLSSLLGVFVTGVSFLMYSELNMVALIEV